MYKEEIKWTYGCVGIYSSHYDKLVLLGAVRAEQIKVFMLVGKLLLMVQQGQEYCTVAVYNMGNYWDQVGLRQGKPRSGNGAEHVLDFYTRLCDARRPDPPVFAEPARCLHNPVPP